MFLTDTSLAIESSPKTAIVFSLPKTVLPDEIKLTPVEAQELFELERCYEAAICKSIRLHKKFRFSAINAGFEIHNTANAGIHYFCVKYKIDLLTLSFNRNISLYIAALIFKKALPIDGYGYFYDGNRSYKNTDIHNGLLISPLVNNNLTLFKEIFNSNPTVNLNTTYFTVLSYTSIDVLMFLLPQKDITAFTKLDLEVLHYRQPEILAWVEENNPELTGLPFAWVMKAFNFNIIS